MKLPEMTEDDVIEVLGLCGWIDGQREMLPAVADAIRTGRMSPEVMCETILTLDNALSKYKDLLDDLEGKVKNKECTQ